MKEKRSQGRSPKADSKPSVRASITFPSDLYETMEQIARQKKVALAWVVWDRAEKYAAEQEMADRKQRER
jgi:hypothetical protein